MYQLRETELSTIREIAICHQECFPNSFSSKLRNSYLTKTLEWFLAGKNRFLFHIEFQNQVIGYCGGFQSLSPGDGSTSGMVQYAMKEAIQGFIRKPHLLFHPEVIRRYPLIIKNIYKRVFKAKKNT